MATSPARVVVAAQATPRSDDEESRHEVATTATSCSLTQTLNLLGDRWVFLVLREVMAGCSRFSQLRSRLSIAPDVLSNRLGALVDGGVLERRQYRDPGARARDSYHLTQAGTELNVVLAALQHWGDRNKPSDLPRLLFTTADAEALTVSFVNALGVAVAQGDVVCQ